LFAFLLTALPSGRETVGQTDTASRLGLGIGFLWRQDTQETASRLTGKKDFVDLILGQGKLDVFDKVKRMTFRRPPHRCRISHVPITR
jgi:hypothetical protein